MVPLGFYDICIPNKPDVIENCVIKTMISLGQWELEQGFQTHNNTIIFAAVISITKVHFLSSSM